MNDKTTTFAISKGASGLKIWSNDFERFVRVGTTPEDLFNTLVEITEAFENNTELNVIFVTRSK